MKSAEHDIRRYLQLFVKKKHIFIIMAIAVTTVIIFGGYLWPKKYEAKSTVFIERSVLNELVKGLAVTTSLEEKLRVLLYALSSRSLLVKAIDNLDINVNKQDRAEMERIIKGFQKNTDIKVKNREGMFVVTYTDENPRLAMNYVNTLVRLYIEENISEKREESYGANRFLSEQIDAFKQKLDTAETELNSHRKNNSLIAIDESSITDDIRSAQGRLEDVRMKRMELETKIDLAKKNFKPSNIKLLSLQKKLDELLVRYTDSYPEVIRARSEIAALKEQQKNAEKPADYQEQDSGSEELTKAEIELAAIKSSEEHLQKIVSAKKAMGRSLPVEKTKYAGLMRERDVYKNIYEELMARLGKSEVSKQMEVHDKTTSFRIIDPAVLPVKPASPDMITVMLLAVFAGLAAGAGIIIILDYIDSSARSVDVIKTLGFPVLAIIPTIKNPEELIIKKRKDILLYKVAGIYAALILALFAMELLDMNFMDKAVSGVSLDVAGIKSLIKGIF